MDWLRLLQVAKLNARVSCFNLVQRLALARGKKPRNIRQGVARVFGFDGYSAGTSTPFVDTFFEILHELGYELLVIEESNDVIGIIRKRESDEKQA